MDNQTFLIVIGAFLGVMVWSVWKGGLRRSWDYYDKGMRGM